MPQGAYLHTAVDRVTFRMIVAKETRVGRQGFEQWVRKRKENHLLDHEIGILALPDPEWPGGGFHLLRQRPAPTVFKQGANPRIPVRPQWMVR
jgi:hypothetical protein